MSGWTRFGAGIWDWRLWYERSDAARLLFLALYTSPRAKLLPTGLYHGGWSAMAEDAHFDAQKVHAALHELIDCKMVEHDHIARVARVTKFPDRGERPSNGRALKRWWSAFQTLPDCAVRNAHVPLIRWLCHPVTSDHEKVWEVTFATLVASDLGVIDSTNSSQRELFDHNNVGVGIATPQNLVDNDSSHMGYPWGEGEGEGSDLGSDLGSGSWISFAAPPTLHGSAMGTATTPPHEPLPFTVAELLAILNRTGQGRFVGQGFDSRLAPALVAVIRQIAKNGWGPVELAVAGEWIAAGSMAWQRVAPGPKWVATTGNMVEAIAQALAWAKNGRPAFRGTVPVGPGVALGATGRAAPAPATAFQRGRQKL